MQRFFLVDSHSVETAIESIRACDPSMVELMPGVVPKVIRRFCGEIRQPVIAGGLIETREEAVQALSAGRGGHIHRHSRRCGGRFDRTFLRQGGKPYAV